MFSIDSKKIKIKIYIVLFLVNIDVLKTLKYHTFLKKYESLPLFAENLEVKMKRYLKKKNQLRC